MKNKKIKKTLVFIPAILLMLFLLNSFVLKEKEAVKKTTKVTKSGLLNIVFRSTDGGQTWQNISKGLPERLQREGMRGGSFFTNEDGLYLRAGNGVYHSEPNSTTSFWTKEIFPGKQVNITPGKNGIFAYTFRGQFLQKTNGTSEWSPKYKNFQEQAVRLDSTVDWMYTHFKEREVRTIFETAKGTVFIGSNNGLFRSTNNGKVWEKVHTGDGGMKLAELNGVLLATNRYGILRSTDNGKNWESVINEGGYGVAVERIDGGFAAIVYNIITQTNRIHISLDNGKTWNTIGEALQPSWNYSLLKLFSFQPSLYVSSIKQVGKYLICNRPDGLFRSSDRGKTWTHLSLPSVENMGFNLSVSGNVMYVMPNKGC